MLSWLKRCKGSGCPEVNEFILMSEENLKAEVTFTPALIEQLARRVVEHLTPIIARNGKNRSNDEIFDVQGLAAYLKVSKKWIYERTHLKEVPYLKIGGQLRFRKKDIDKWVDTYKVPAVSTSVGILKALS